MMQGGQGTCAQCPVLQAVAVAQHQVGEGSQVLQQGQGVSRQESDLAAAVQIDTLQAVHACAPTCPVMAQQAAAFSATVGQMQHAAVGRCNTPMLGRCSSMWGNRSLPHGPTRGGA